MSKFLDITLTGLSAGMVYSAVALALVLIWRATRVVNFAQGGMAMITTYIAITVIDRGYGYWWAFSAALLSGLLLGAVLERLIVRRVENAPPLNAVVVTLGLLVLLTALAGLIWGNSSRASVPTPFSLAGYSFGKTTVGFGRFDTFLVLAVLAVMALLVALFRFTGLGLAMRASAYSQEVARLVGVRVGRMLTLGWALAAVAGSLAGILVAPRVPLSPNFMDGPNIIGFTAAVVGSLDSPPGAVVGGVGIGLALSYVSGYLGADFALPATLGILILVLMIRPEGLFSRAQARVV